MKIKKVTFQGWKNCVEMKSGDFKLIVTTEIGPRVIGAFCGKSKNLFHVDPALAGKKGPTGEWVNYGGHRLWHSPETKERTYEPDNGESKVTVKEREEGGLEFSTPADRKTGIAKSIAIFPEEEGTFRVVHTIRNEGVWTVEAAAWALSVMAPGGVAFAAQNQNEMALLPSTFYSIWPYTKFDDPRIEWGGRFLVVRQDPSADRPLKVGFNCQDGQIAYLNNGVLFLKQFIFDEEAQYPDNGCSIEIYTNGEMLEAETLSPLELLEPGDAIQHVEFWTAIPTDIKVKSEADLKEIFSEDEDDCCCGDSCCEAAPAKKKKTSSAKAKKSASGKKKASGK